ncbi:ATP-binding protein [Streptomyces sp. WMMC897]|nr:MULTISPECIES: ATP-binding protein [unclassified Streptomyces]MCZ7417515.1 ATP-binding protein [Streptomyces sp. WMMC897]MCZ7432656.1 ATP-binding protein [Streptomyces sp. WMMC1477]
MVDCYDSNSTALTVSFLALPTAVPELRWTTRSHLARWGHSDLADAAELCVSELVTNVIRHVGEGTPATLTAAVSAARLRVELSDPDTEALPRPSAPSANDECGRGLALMEAICSRWGVVVGRGGKTVWCEIQANQTADGGACQLDETRRTHAVLTLYGARGTATSPLAQREASEAAVTVIADILSWLCARGHDPDTLLDNAQARFEARRSGGSVPRERAVW